MPPRRLAARRANRVRIIGGAWRSRLIEFPALPGLRPTPDRVRETLFNWLGQTLDGLTCLDLFAGSGALGLEAASRGAKQVTLIERDARACAALRRNATALGATRVSVVRAEALAWLVASGSVYDVIFLDPPFGTDLLRPLLEMSPAHLAEGGRVYAESGTALVAPPGLRLMRGGRAGQVHFGLFEKTDTDHA